MSKPFWQSRTFWVNALTLVATILAAVVADASFAEYAQYITMALALVNIVLRAVTTEGVTLTTPRPGDDVGAKEVQP